MRYPGFMALVATILVVLVACDYQPNATQIESQKQEQLTKQAVQAVGMPAIVNFQEKRILKNILELRDQQIKTITYTQDFNAKLHKVCDSVGYGIPYATQYTNPEMITDNSPYGRVQGWYTLPQADPNGLYSPPGAEGTWVMCLNPETKDLAPVYVEPRIVVSPFPLAGAQ